mmetsp:Transcript_44978/g.88276  ORF Transcript_44978/g.88276 Transcript_44978/m.88276 type:complete len:572 (+) Transcript_44978:277-1992(+)
MSKFDKAKSKEIWEEHIDNDTGDLYYLNPSTNQTTFSKPKGKIVSYVDDDLWEEHFNDGVLSYINIKTKVVLWDTPRTGRIIPFNAQDVWEEQIDAVTGLTFYINNKTNQRTRKRPNAKVIAHDDVWEEHRDPNTGDLFYANVKNEKVTWHKPDGKILELGDIWEEHLDETTGDMYYMNPKTNETTWQKPAGEVISAVPKDVWEEHEDEHGNLYYFCPLHDATSWKRPVGVPIVKKWAKDAWDECVDHKTGDKYWIHQQTKQVTFTKPSGMIMHMEDLWIEYLDEESGEPYYKHAKTHETTWERPTGKIIKDGENHEEEVVWEELEDPTDGMKYYHNTTTGETVWEKPETGTIVKAADLDKGVVWETLRSDEGEFYYHNVNTGETAWEIPSGPNVTVIPFHQTGAITAAVPAVTAVTAGAAEPVTAPAVAAGGTAANQTETWETLADEEGDHYYHNLTTGETSWELPSGPNVTVLPFGEEPPVVEEAGGGSTPAGNLQGLSNHMVDKFNLAVGSSQPGKYKPLGKNGPMPVYVSKNPKIREKVNNLRENKTKESEGKNEQGTDKAQADGSS